MQGNALKHDYLFFLYANIAAHLILLRFTCNSGFFQEPLRASISSQLRTSLQGLNIANEILEQAVQLVTNDNLDLGCAVIEQAATDKVSYTNCILLVVVISSF